MSIVKQCLYFLKLSYTYFILSHSQTLRVKIKRDMDVPDTLAGAPSARGGPDYLSDAVQSSMMSRKAKGFTSSLLPITNPGDRSVAYDNPLYEGAESQQPDDEPPYATLRLPTTTTASNGHATPENIYS